MSPTGVRERPILFSSPMVKAILAGTKTQTRRILNERDMGSFLGAPGQGHDPRCWGYIDPAGGHHPLPMRYGEIGDRLWVRETWGYVKGAGVRVVYRADGVPTDRFRGTPIDGMKWIPSIHMFRRDSRLTLEITEVRVQRLQEISEEDAKAEGVTPLGHIGPGQPVLDTVRGRTHGTHPHVLAYAVAWDTLNDERAPWARNPWVWCLSFRRVA